jgi:thiol-disulfide isomerase/thioredoxin
MIALLAVTLANAAPPPAVEVAWKGAKSTVHIVAPAGHHVAEDAPVDLILASPKFEAHLMGADVAKGLPVADLRGQAVNGSLDVSICTDDNTSCQRVSVAVYGAVPAEKKGRIGLAVREQAARFDMSAFEQDAAKVAEAAYAQAATEGKLVLLDFTAVWCPPCNALAVEVLHAADRPAVLDRYVVAAIDVDDPSSWRIKDQFAVSGYPTLVVAKADGSEVSRTVGYGDRARFVAWLERSAGENPGYPAPDAVDPAEAGRIAWELVQADQDAAAYLAKASDSAETRMARVVSAPTVDDARWLVQNAKGRSLDWVPGAMDLGEEPDGRAVLREALVQDATVGTLVQRSDRMAYLAELADEGDEKPLWAAAAALLEASYTGEPAKDRPTYTALADFLAKSGDTDAAVAFLDRASEAFPDDPTFLMSATRHLLKAERAEEALRRADRALPLTWGDNRLRLATSRCEALVKLGRGDEAKRFAEQILAEVPAPSSDLDVRTPKYRQKLAEAAGVDNL